MSSSKRAFGGLFWTISASLINAFYAFFSVPILLLHFGKEQFGLIGLAFQINVYLVLMDFGLAHGNIRYFSQWIARNQFSRASKLFQSSFVFYGTIGIIHAIILGVISYYSQSLWHLKGNQVEIVHNLFYILMVSAFFGWISSLFDQFLKANEIIGWEQRLVIFVKIVQVFILYLTIKYNFSVVMYVMLASFSALLILPFTVLRIRKLKYKVSFVPRYYNSIFKQILPYSLSVFAVGFFQFSANNLRPIVLSFRASILAVADFRILNGFASTIMLMSVGFVGVLLPMATKAVALGNTEGRDKIAYEGTKYLTVFLSVIVFGFILVSKDLLHLYVGEKYAYLDIWLNIWVLTMLFSHTSAISSLVFAENKLRPVVYISAFSAATSLTLAWFLIPRYQVGGIVLSYLYYCISQVTFYYSYYYRKILKLNVVKILLRSFFRPMFGIGVCALLTYFVTMNLSIQNRYFRVIITGCTFLAFATPIIYFIILSMDDKFFIKKLLTREKNAQPQAEKKIHKQ